MEYAIDKGDFLICNLCTHHCKLLPQKGGICGVNINSDGKFKNLVYAHPITLNIDPIEKKPLYHFLPGSKTLSLGTVGCNFRCPFCQNWEISQASFEEGGYTLEPKAIAKEARDRGTPSISFTYNEPTIFYPYAKDIALEAKKYNIKSIFVTNGMESEDLVEDAKGVIDALNIDLKSFNQEYYKKALRGDLESIKRNIRRFYELGFWIEVTTLLIEEVNSSQEEIEKMADFLSSISRDIPWHISAFFPNYKMLDKERTKKSSIFLAMDIAKDRGMRYVYSGNISEANSTICSGCGEVLISRVGYEVINNLNMERCKKCDKILAGVYG